MRGEKVVWPRRGCVWWERGAVDALLHGREPRERVCGVCRTREEDEEEDGGEEEEGAKMMLPRKRPCVRERVVLLDGSYCVVPARAQQQQQQQQQQQRKQGFVVPPGLTVGCAGRGEVCFLDGVRLRSSTLGDALEGLVTFPESGVVNVRQPGPEEEEEEEEQEEQDPGKGGFARHPWFSALRVTLRGVSPRPGQTWEELVDRLRKRCARQGTRHVLYDHVAGTWVFEVPRR